MGTMEALTTPAAEAPVHPDFPVFTGGEVSAGCAPLSAEPHNPTMPAAAPSGASWGLGQVGRSQEEGALWTYVCHPAAC